MDRDTKIELLKIGAMIIILIALIIGIVWMNKDSSNVNNDLTEETSEYNEEDQTEEDTNNSEGDEEESTETQGSEESTETPNTEESTQTENQ